MLQKLRFRNSAGTPRGQFQSRKPAPDSLTHAQVPAADAAVRYEGRVLYEAPPSGSVRFDWPGTAMRVCVQWPADAPEAEREVWVRLNGRGAVFNISANERPMGQLKTDDSEREYLLICGCQDPVTALELRLRTEVHQCIRVSALVLAPLDARLQETQVQPHGCVGMAVHRRSQGGTPPPPRPPFSLLLPFQCLRLTAKILLRRLRCQEELSSLNFGPSSAGTMGGPWEEGCPSQPPLPSDPPPPFPSNPRHPDATAGNQPRHSAHEAT